MRKQPGKVIELNKQQLKRKQKEQQLEKRRKSKLLNKSNKNKFNLNRKHIIALIIVIAICILFHLLNNYHIYGLNFDKTATLEDAKIIETMNTDNILKSYDKNIISLQKGVIYCYDAKGKIQWSKKLEEMYEPDINTAGKYIQVINYDTGYIYVLEGEYEVCRIKISGTILSAIINEEGTSVVEYSTSGLKTVVGVYTNKGTEKCMLKLDSNTVAAYAISSNSRYLAYSYADISGISLITKVDVVDLSNLQGDVFNTIFEKNNQLVYKIYWEGNSLKILLDKCVINYDAGKKVTENQLESLITVDMYNSKIAYVVNEDSKYVIKVDKFNGKNIGEVEISEVPKHFAYTNDLIYVCLQNEIYAYNKWGKCVKQILSDNAVTKPVVFNSGKSIAYTISNKIYIFTI